MAEALRLAHAGMAQAAGAPPGDAAAALRKGGKGRGKGKGKGKGQLTGRAGSEDQNRLGEPRADLEYTGGSLLLRVPSAG
jgi:hypothetical protein